MSLSGACFRRTDRYLRFVADSPRLMNARAMPPYESPPPESALLLPYYFAARLGMPQHLMYDLCFGEITRESHIARARVVARALHLHCVGAIVDVERRDLEMPD